MTAAIDSGSVRRKCQRQNGHCTIDLELIGSSAAPISSHVSRAMALQCGQSAATPISSVVVVRVCFVCSMRETSTPKILGMFAPAYKGTEQVFHMEQSAHRATVWIP